MLSVIVPALVMLLAGALATPEASAEERYVADHVDITLRSGPSKEFRIRRMVKGGSKVEVLERNNRGYSLVLSAEGTKGWVLSRYLVRGPVEPQQVAEGEVQETGVNEPEADKSEAVEAGTDAVAEQLEAQTVEEAAPIADAAKETETPQETPSLQATETPSTEEPPQESAVQEPALQEVVETSVAGTASEATIPPEPVPASFEGQSLELPATPFAQQLEDQLNNVLKGIGQIQDRLGEARSASPDIAPDIALVRDEITALKQELEYSRKQQTASSGNETRKPDERERWLLIGAGVFVAGTLMGMLISRVSWRRRRSASSGLRLDF